MKRVYEKPAACIEAFSLGTAVTIEATSRDTTDDALARETFDFEDTPSEGGDSWSDVW